MSTIIEVISTIGDVENTTDPATSAKTLRGVSTAEWGVDADGNAYFSPQGADDGERAFLSVDSTGLPWLETVDDDEELVLDVHRFQSALVTLQREYVRRPDARLFPHAPIRATSRRRRRR